MIDAIDNDRCLEMIDVIASISPPYTNKST